MGQQDRQCLLCYIIICWGVCTLCMSVSFVCVCDIHPQAFGGTIVDARDRCAEWLLTQIKLYKLLLFSSNRRVLTTQHRAQ